MPHFMRRHIVSQSKNDWSERMIAVSVIFPWKFIFWYEAVWWMSNVKPHFCTRMFTDFFDAQCISFEKFLNFPIQFDAAYHMALVGVPTFKKNSSDWAGWYIFRTTFRKDFKNVNLIKIGSCPSTRKLCLACLLNFAEQATWAEFAGRGGWSG